MAAIPIISPGISSPKSSSQKVKNPKTGRMIFVGKGTYNALIGEGYVISGDTMEKPTSPEVSSLTAELGKITVSEPVKVLSQDLGEAPKSEGLKQEFLGVIRKDRDEMCNICQAQYVKRIRDLRPFKKEDYNHLKNRVVPACERCSDLLEQEIKLVGQSSSNFVETYRLYKQASIQSRQKLDHIESQIRLDGIRMASAGTLDPGIFFPAAPSQQP